MLTVMNLDCGLAGFTQIVIAHAWYLSRSFIGCFREFNQWQRSVHFHLVQLTVALLFSEFLFMPIDWREKALRRQSSKCPSELTCLISLSWAPVLRRPVVLRATKKKMVRLIGFTKTWKWRDLDCRRCMYICRRNQFLALCDGCLPANLSKC